MKTTRRSFFAFLTAPFVAVVAAAWPKSALTVVDTVDPPWIDGRKITITGLDQFGNEISETIDPAAMNREFDEIRRKLG